MNRPTPQEQAENMLAGLKNTYQAVAKRHVHPWYTWAILAAAIGFTVGVAYVANQDVEFSSSRAATAEKMQEIITALDQEVPDVPREPADIGAGQVVKTFVSDGSEKVAVFIPTIRKIEDEDSKFMLLVGVALAAIGAPGPLDFIGAFAGEFVGTAIGASGTFFNTIVSGAVEDGINYVLEESVPVLYPGGQAASRFGGAINGGISGNAIVGSFKRMADNTVKVVADGSIKAVRAAAKELRVKAKAEWSKGNYFSPIVFAAVDVPKIEQVAIASIRKSQEKYNPVLARYKTELIRNSAVTVLNGMRNSKSKYVAGEFAQDQRYKAIEYMKAVADNTEGVITTATIDAYAARQSDHYLEYDRLNRPTVILPGTKKPWPATLPGSQWVGFRDNLDVPGKGPRKYTIMNVVKKIEVVGTPTEGILQFMTTNKQTDVVVNGVRVYSIPPSRNRIIEPTTAIALDISRYLLPGINRIAIYTVQAGDNGQRFGVNFAGYIAATP